jgi:hypothetical protein
MGEYSAKKSLPGKRKIAEGAESFSGPIVSGSLQICTLVVHGRFVNRAPKRSMS